MRLYLLSWLLLALLSVTYATEGEEGEGGDVVEGAEGGEEGEGEGAENEGEGEGHEEGGEEGEEGEGHGLGEGECPVREEECEILVETRDHWSYNLTHCWHEQYCDCGGLHQSPINIVTKDIVDDENENYLQFARYYPVKDLEVVNNGKSLQVTNADAGYLVVGHDYYFIHQYHLHFPSEHTIDGEHYYAELHILHQKQHSVEGPYELLVTAILFTLGEESPLLKQIMTEEPPVPGQEKEIDQPVDLLRALGPVLDKDFYRYNGSLTTPPCTESVKWFVMKTPMTVSIEQFESFKLMFPMPANIRPVQPLNGRKVKMNAMHADGEVKVVYNAEFMLTYHRERDRRSPPEGLILWAVFGGLIIAFVAACASFVREEKRRRQMGNGGLVEIIGKGPMAGLAASAYAPIQA